MSQKGHLMLKTLECRNSVLMAEKSQDFSLEICGLHILMWAED